MIIPGRSVKKDWVMGEFRQRNIGPLNLALSMSWYSLNGIAASMLEHRTLMFGEYNQSKVPTVVPNSV